MAPERPTIFCSAQKQILGQIGQLLKLCKCKKAFSFMGLRPTPSPEALPLDTAGGSAPDPCCNSDRGSASVQAAPRVKLIARATDGRTMRCGTTSSADDKQLPVRRE